MEEKKFEWCPLESDPAIFNNYFKTLGMDFPKFEFQELLSLDYKEIQEVDLNKICGVIVNQKKLVSPDVLYCIDGNYFDHKSVEFYMKQDDRLYNACGVVAGLNLLGNIKQSSINNESWLEKFYSESKFNSPEERCEKLSNDEEIKQVHSFLGGEGQSNNDIEEMKKVKHHYVSFIRNEKGEIFELDGRLQSPYFIYQTENKTEFLDKVIAEIKRRLSQNLISEILSILILVQH
jgi:hypothetical protein